MNDLKPNTIYIDSWNSVCGSCGRDCDPNESQHDSWLGYAALAVSDKEDISYPLEGCHAEYLYTSYVGPGYISAGNSYQEYAREICLEMRPDLECLN